MLLLLIVCFGISNRLAAVVSLDLPHQHAMLHFVNFNAVGFCMVSNYLYFHLTIFNAQ